MVYILSKRRNTSQKIDVRTSTRPLQPDVSQQGKGAGEHPDVHLMHPPYTGWARDGRANEA